jgi:hypothetical protein
MPDKIMYISKTWGFFFSNLYLYCFLYIGKCKSTEGGVFFDRRVDELREWCEQHMMCVVLTIIHLVQDWLEWLSRF